MALPSLSQRTPRESPTLATVSSLSDSRATRHVVPGREGSVGGPGEDGKVEEERGGAEEGWGGNKLGHLFIFLLTN